MAKKTSSAGKYSLDPIKSKSAVVKSGDVECIILHAPDVEHESSQDGVVNLSFSVCT